jgi:hypothetical protein
LAYILAPAREWAGFDQLNVKVQVPTGWRFKSEPVLDSAGANEFSGTFSGVPADHLALTAQAPFDEARLLPIGHWPGLATLVLAVVLGPALAWGAGRSGGVRHAAGPIPWLRFGLGFLVCTVVVTTVVISAFLWFVLGQPADIPANQGNWNATYGHAFLAFGGVILGTPLVFAVAGGAYAASYAWARRNAG